MPFAGGIEDLSNGTLIFSAISAFFYLAALRQPPSWRRTVAKTAATGLLAVLAVMEGGPWLLVAALALSAAGDAFLSQDGEPAFLSGLGSFLLAHVAYVALFVMTGAGIEILTAQTWRIPLPVIVLIASVPLILRLIPAVGDALRIPVAVYVAAILAMMIASAMVPAPIIMIGAALFVASDAILASERFLLGASSWHRIWTGPAVWVLYYLAQLAITLGFLI
ncbi:lysoplasmalogenase [Mesorhizobium sp. CAU 1732]|uniref:lysoplasmalogenase n=1 Tax=Mesorhizobium sp. CAU 1732 TaxID=3140358 RepID=UPI003260F7F1